MRALSVPDFQSRAQSGQVENLPVFNFFEGRDHPPPACRTLIM